MKCFVFTLIILINCQLFAQHGSQRAIEINNKISDKHIAVTGTKLYITLPKGFVNSLTFLGYRNELAGSSIIISEVPGDVHRNFIGFDKKYLFKAGLVSESETYYKINNFDALLIKGKQAAYGIAYNRILLIIGDIYRTYIINASIPTNLPNKDYNDLLNALLSIIYNPDLDTDALDRYNFTLDITGTQLKKANIMYSSMTFTDDGNMPSKTEEKTSLTARRNILAKAFNEDEKTKLCTQIFETYPIEWHKDINRTPKPIKIGKYNGYEIFSLGKNKNIDKNEFVYQTIIFIDTDYYVITGLTYGSFEENLVVFRKITNTFKLK